MVATELVNMVSHIAKRNFENGIHITDIIIGRYLSHQCEHSLITWESESREFSYAEGRRGRSYNSEVR